MWKRPHILFLIFFLAVCSCKKDVPAGYPSVQISAPYLQAIFNVPCTIQVTGHASDSKSLTSISVYIANGQNIALEPPIQIPVTSNSMNISCSYRLNDIHLPSGQYYMTITASNGTNTASAFQQIYIDAVPTRRLAIYAITRDATGVHAWGIDSTFKVSPYYSYTVPGDYSSSDINSYYQQLYIAGHDSGDVSVRSVPLPAPDWAISANHSPVPSFTNVYCSNDAEFVSYYANNMPNGYVKEYSHLGALQAQYNATSGYYPVKTYMWGNFLLTEEQSISLSQSEWLHIFYASTSASYNQTTLPGPVVASRGYDNNDIFIFGNTTSGDGFIKLYSIPNNAFYSPPFSLNAYGKLLSAIQINANTYLLGFNNGNIYQYTYNPVSIVPFIHGVKASVMQYDSINNEIIIASGKTLNKYHNATLVASVTLSDSIRDVRVLYNK